MARTPKPWFREDRNAWFVTIRGERHNLGTDEKEARRQFHLLMAEPEKPQHSKPTTVSEITIAEIFDKFIDWVLTHREQRTYKDYLDYTQQFLTYLKDKATMPVASLKQFHVVEWVDSHKGWNNTTRRKAIIHIQRPFNWAAKLGYIPDNPVRHIEKPQAKRRDNPVLSSDFIEIIGKVRDESFRDLLSFAWETGCRPQEVRHIQIRHIEENRIVIPPAEAKGRKRWRIIRLNDAALAIVRRHQSGRKEGNLFLNTDGNPWKTSAICCRFTRLKEKLGKRWAAYDFRHGFCQKMLESGADHLVVAEIMGHANGQMVAAVYSHMNRAEAHLDEALKKASGASK